MKNFIKLLSFSTLFLFANCKKLENKSKDEYSKKTLLAATQNFSSLDKIERTFKIFTDSTYLFTESINQGDYNKLENFKGKLEIENDTIKFSQGRLKYNSAETAVLKNNFVEFCDGEFPYRMKILNTSLKVTNLVDFKNLPNYAVFTYYKKFENDSYKSDFQNYSLNTQELNQVDIILKNTFKANKDLMEFSNYLKQVESVKYKNGNIIINIRCFCKENFTLERFQYDLIRMNDGGNCNVFIKVNLTAGKVESINIAGIA